MKISVVLVLFLIGLCLSKEPIQVTLFESPEEPESNDYVEVVLIVGEKDTSLPKALSNAAKKVLAVQQRALTFCGDPEKRKCIQSIDAGNAKIESKYQLVKKEDTFMGFSVQHEVTIKVYKTDQIGELVDTLQLIGVKKFESFTWKGNKEVAAQSAVVEGAIERAETLCSTIGYKVDRVVSIERHVPEEEEQKKEGEQEGGAADEQDEQSQQLYKVQLECVQKKTKGRASDQL